MKPKFTKQEIEDLLDITTLNIKYLGNAINQYTAAANTLEKKDKEYQEKKSAYLHRIHILKLKQREEEVWATNFKKALNLAA
jgi:hypothetical protein